MVNIMNNKKGWIKIVEAFLAILLVAGVLLFVINKGYIGTRDISEQVYQAQLAVLREIELNSELRLQVLTNTEVTPEIKNKIDERMPSYLECTSAICNLSLACSIPEGEAYPYEKEIYAQAVAIAAEKEEYGPRQLKMFCWTN